jgi:hypothetical protein
MNRIFIHSTNGLMVCVVDALDTVLGDRIGEHAVGIDSGEQY